MANGDVTYAIEISTILAAGSWTPVTPTVNSPTEISYALPPGEARIFARLKITQAN